MAKQMSDQSERLAGLARLDRRDPQIKLRQLFGVGGPLSQHGRIRCARFHMPSPLMLRACSSPRSGAHLSHRRMRHYRLPIARPDNKDALEKFLIYHKPRGNLFTGEHGVPTQLLSS